MYHLWIPLSCSFMKAGFASFNFPLLSKGPASYKGWGGIPTELLTEEPGNTVPNEIFDLFTSCISKYATARPSGLLRVCLFYP